MNFTKFFNWSAETRSCFQEFFKQRKTMSITNDRRSITEANGLVSPSWRGVVYVEQQNAEILGDGRQPFTLHNWLLVLRHKMHTEKGKPISVCLVKRPGANYTWCRAGARRSARAKTKTSNTRYGLSFSSRLARPWQWTLYWWNLICSRSEWMYKVLRFKSVNTASRLGKILPPDEYRALPLEAGFTDVIRTSRWMVS